MPSGDNSAYQAVYGDAQDVIQIDPESVSEEMDGIVFNEGSFSTSQATYTPEFSTTTYHTKLFEAIGAAQTFWDTMKQIAEDYEAQAGSTPPPALPAEDDGGRDDDDGGDDDNKNPNIPSDAAMQMPEVEVMSDLTITDIASDDLRSLSNGILKLAEDYNTNVESLLSNSGLSQQIKDLLVGLPLSEDLLSLASQMDADDLRDFLKSLYDGTNAQMVTVTEPLMSYLEYLEKSSSLTNILGDANNAYLLKNGLSSFKNVNNFLNITDDNELSQIKMNLLYIENGYVQDFNLDENSLQILRLFNHQLAEIKNVSVEELFISNNYDDFIKEQIIELKNTSAYLAALSDTTSTNAQKTLNSLVNKKQEVL